jgi:hypothetical protein
MDLPVVRILGRVSQNGESFTTTFQKFTFFSVTDCNQCLAFGPGLVDGGLAGKTSPTVFVIQVLPVVSLNDFLCRCALSFTS